MATAGLFVPVTVMFRTFAANPSADASPIMMRPPQPPLTLTLSTVTVPELFEMMAGDEQLVNLLLVMVVLALPAMLTPSEPLVTDRPWTLILGTTAPEPSLT